MFPRDHYKIIYENKIELNSGQIFWAQAQLSVKKEGGQ